MAAPGATPPLRPADLARRWWPAIVTVVLVGAVLWPLGQRHDSYPLSTYPMFTSERPPVSSVYRAVAVDADGQARPLGPRVIGGTVEVMHAHSSIARAVADGTVAALCDEIAVRAVEADDATVEVRIVRERYDVVAAVADDVRTPTERTEVARCAVP